MSSKSKQTPTNVFATPFTWIKYTASGVNTLNEPVVTMTDNGTLWGRHEALGSTRSQNYDGPQTWRHSTIHIHQLPALSPKDQLTDKRTGLTYDIDSLYIDYEANEVVCECTHRGA
jgi:hypothetical protein